MQGGWNQRLTLIRCIAAYSVVFLHIRFPGELGVAINCLARFAVPLFFMSAGYLTYECSSWMLFRRVIRNLYKLVVSCIPPLILEYMVIEHSRMPVKDYLSNIFTLEHLRHILLLQELWIPYAWPLWFLAAMVILCVISWVCSLIWRRRPLPHRLLTLCAVALLAAHLYWGEGRILQGLEPVESIYLRNVWLDGLPFFMLGACMASREEQIRRRARPWLVCCGILFGCGLSLVERSHTGFLDLHLGSVIVAVNAMKAAIAWPDLGWDPARIRRLSFMGSVTFFVYVLHIPVYGLIKECSQISIFVWIMAHPMLRPWIVAGCTTLLSLPLAGMAAYPKARRTTQ